MADHTVYPQVDAVITIKPTEFESVWLKSMRLSINLVTHIMMTLTVIVCVVFACSAPRITNYHLHIILCALGYQFFMCQGILVMSKYNSWSLFMKRLHRRHIHWILQVVALVLVIVGSSLIMKDKAEHFSTTHGTLGICALVVCLVGWITGILAMYTHKLCSLISVLWMKYIHFFSGIAALVLSTASVTIAFESVPFATWLNNDALLPTIVSLTWLFTIFIAIDFCIITGNRIFCLM